MAIQWLTNKGILQPVHYEEETILSTDPYVIAFNSTVEGNTITSSIVTSTLPDTLTVKQETNSIKIYGVLPTIIEDTDYDIVIKLVEYNGTTQVSTSQRYFTVRSLHKVVGWTSTIKTNLETNSLVDYYYDFKAVVDNANGNEVYKKVSGELPDGLKLQEDGELIGFINEEDARTTPYSFGIAIYADDEQIVQPKVFELTVKSEAAGGPFWVTSSGIIGSLDYGKKSDCSIYAMDLSTTNAVVTYILSTENPLLTGLPPGLSLDNNGKIEGTVTTKQNTEWSFGAYAYSNGLYSEYREFSITTNVKEKEHEITWGDSEIIDGGTYTIGETIIGELPKATVTDGSTLTYTASESKIIKIDDEIYSGKPEGLYINDNGSISGKLEYQPNGDYYFPVTVSSPYTYIIKKVKLSIKKGLGENAVKAYLRINNEYKDEYNEIKDQLNPETNYRSDISAYTVDTFPKIDVATLTCYDREILGSILNYGNPEVVRVGKTISKVFSQINDSGESIANYEVIYKEIDESTLAWNDFDKSGFDYNAKLQEQKEEGIVDQQDQIDFNNTDYDSDTWKGADGNRKDNKCTYYDETGTALDVVVKTDPRVQYNVFNFENVRNQLAQKFTVYKKTGTYYYDCGNQAVVGTNLPVKILYQYEEDYYIADVDGSNEQLVTYEGGIVKLNGTVLTNTVIKPYERVYTKHTFKPIDVVYQRYDTTEYEWIDVHTIVYVDYNDILERGVGSTNNKNKFIAYDSNIEPIIDYADQNMYCVLNGELGDLTGMIFYWVDNQNQQQAGVGNYTTTVTTLYKNIGENKASGGNSFVIDSNETRIVVDTIDDPWCYGLDNTLKIAGLPTGTEMVLPKISDNDVSYDDNNNPYIQLLDEEIEPLPAWKTTEPITWTSNTTYKVSDIIVHEELYYLALQQFTSGIVFEYDENNLKLLTKEELSTLLTKKYFPTLDLGYYTSGTNRNYLKVLNAQELEGKYWYNRDFIFWDMVFEPMYTNDLAIGVPFYSMHDHFEEYISDKAHRPITFTIVLHTEDATVNITTTSGSEITVSGDEYTVEVEPGDIVSWTVSKDKYYSEGETFVISESETIDVTLMKRCIITIYPTPSDATVTLTAEGYTPGGTATVTYRPLIVTGEEGWLASGTYYIKPEYPSDVNANGFIVYNDVYDSTFTKIYYNTIPFRCIDTQDGSEKPFIIDLPGMCTTYINPTPSTASVVLTSTGATQEGNSITTVVGQRIDYVVSANGYVTQSGYITNTINRVVDIALNEYPTLTISPNPEDATVILSATGYTQSGNSITVAPGTVVSYVVSKTGYVTVTGTYTVTETHTETITLSNFVTVTISPTPSDAEVKLVCPGYTQVDNAITVPYYTQMKWYVSKSNYEMKSGTLVPTEDTTLPVTLTPLVVYTITAQAGAEVYINGEQRTSIKVPQGTEIWYVVQQDGYVTKRGTETITETKTETINLDKLYRFTLNVDQEDAEIVITSSNASFVQDGNHIDATTGTSIYWTVRKSGYVPMSGSATINGADITENKVMNPFVTWTVTSDPSGATITLTCDDYTQVDNYITVPKGSTVHYEISKTGYVTRSGNEVINTTSSTCFTLTSLVTLTINPVPTDATVTLTASGYTQVGNSITTAPNTPITYNVAKEGYVTATGTLSITADTTQTVTLTDYVTLTVTPTPADATVTLTCPGYTQTGNSIMVPNGSTVSYSVSKEHYDTISNSVVVTSTEERYVVLSETLYKFEITPTPSDATVILTCDGFTQVDNYIRVTYGKTVSWSVSKEHYVAQSGTETITTASTKFVSLNLETFTYTIAPTPSDATVTLTAAGYTQSGKSITVPYGTDVEVSVSKEHYVTRTFTHTVTRDWIEAVTIVLQQFTFTLTPTPSDATVVLTADGYTQSGNTITVDYGTEITYSVSKEHYTTVTNTYIVVADVTYPVSLNLQTFTYTITPVPSDSTVTLTCGSYGQVNNSIIVPYNSTVTWQVSKTGYVTKSGTRTITTDMQDTVELAPYLTLTINPTPADATVTLTASGYTQSGNSITVPYNTIVTYTVAKTDYITESGTHTVIADITLPIELTPDAPAIDVEGYSYELDGTNKVTLTKYVGIEEFLTTPNVDISE